jgi:hypothetical protein
LSLVGRRPECCLGLWGRSSRTQPTCPFPTLDQRSARRPNAPRPLHASAEDCRSTREVVPRCTAVAGVAPPLGSRRHFQAQAIGTLIEKETRERPVPLILEARGSGSPSQTVELERPRKRLWNMSRGRVWLSLNQNGAAAARQRRLRLRAWRAERRFARFEAFGVEALAAGDLVSPSTDPGAASRSRVGRLIESVSQASIQRRSAGSIPSGNCSIATDFAYPHAPTSRISPSKRPRAPITAR